MSGLKKLTILKRIKFDLLLDAKLVYIFGKSGGEVFIVTNRDETYAYGSNIDGCLGLGHIRPVDEPTRVDKLCAKQIIKIVCTHFNSGYNYSLALTNSGNVYAWGSNANRTIANFGGQYSYEPNLVSSLDGMQVIDISCSFHCLALTRIGHVYAWGANMSAQISTGGHAQYQCLPIRVNMNGAIITAICCGGNHSLALSESGVVYSWGDNKSGQLGIGMTKKRSGPTKIILDRHALIVKISAGLHHSVVLTTGGDVYCFGRNQYGQIGDGSTHDISIPIKISLISKICDIGSLSSSNMTAALSRDGHCFVWGDCVECAPKPKQTNENCINEAFVNHSHSNITLRAIHFGRIFTDNTPIATTKPVMFERHGKSFNDPNYSDLTFKVDGKLIHAQKLYLKSCCKHFDTMFADNRWTESGSNCIDISQYSYPAFYAFLKYLYTNTVDISVDDAIDLLDLANSYLEVELMDKCVEMIKSGITVENVCHLYASAIKYNSTELESYCFDFAKHRMEHIFATEAFKRMDEFAVKRLFVKAWHK